ncbi:hypothetical protein [Aurantiacibacter zhengii]|uniref:Uncharacterized protein n=1 Tax=Aurantiacibacter zhengii TaxID=2307003 RepID=A0A418NTK0_9SPHN|nr:hypothetical protein [Aurantiacibacter zhengii]RIV87477.1 hypothetical protein D2V07_03765 [Aurantiacibacter zhengii]
MNAHNPRYPLTFNGAAVRPALVKVLVQQGMAEPLAIETVDCALFAAEQAFETLEDKIITARPDLRMAVRQTAWAALASFLEFQGKRLTEVLDAVQQAGGDAAEALRKAAQRP